MKQHVRCLDLPWRGGHAHQSQLLSLAFPEQAISSRRHAQLSTQIYFKEERNASYKPSLRLNRDIPRPMI